MTSSGGTGPFTIAGVKGLPAGVVPIVNGRTISFTGPATEAGTFDAASITIDDSAGASIKRFSASPSIRKCRWNLIRGGT
jgi:hypothetical protein